MGYEYAIHGWYESRQPVDLNVVPVHGSGGYNFVEHDGLGSWVRVTGRQQNYVLFATEAKHRANYYVSALSNIMAASGDAGQGLITIIGEWCYDGKDRFVVARDGKLSALPTARIYDPLSPWNAVYHWSHYMSRKTEELIPADLDHRREAIAARDSVKGWVYLREPLSEDDLKKMSAEIVGRERRLEGGISFLNQYSEPYLLIGQDAVDAATVVMLLAEITAKRENTYGMLYCSAAGEESQVPVALERGCLRILEEIAMRTENCSKQHPMRMRGWAAAFRQWHFVHQWTCIC